MCATLIANPQPEAPIPDFVPALPLAENLCLPVLQRVATHSDATSRPDAQNLSNAWGTLELGLSPELPIGECESHFDAACTLAAHAQAETASMHTWIEAGLLSVYRDKFWARRNDEHLSDERTFVVRQGLGDLFDRLKAAPLRSATETDKEQPQPSEGEVCVQTENERFAQLIKIAGLLLVERTEIGKDYFPGSWREAYQGQPIRDRNNVYKTTEAGKIPMYMINARLRKSEVPAGTRVQKDPSVLSVRYVKLVNRAVAVITEQTRSRAYEGYYSNSDVTMKWLRQEIAGTQLAPQQQNMLDMMGVQLEHAVEEHGARYP